MLRKLLHASALASMLTIGTVSPSLAEDAKRSAIFLVIENGGVVTDKDAASETIRFMLGELVQLRQNRGTRNTQIHIIATANPTEVAWSGSPQQLFEEGEAVLERLAFKDTCSDLMLAWDQVSITAQITMPEEITLLGIGPLIHAGFPCDDEAATIALPQAAPDGLKLGPLALQAKFVRLLNVHADQDEAYLTYLQETGVLAKARAGELDFDLMDGARTRSAQGRILGEK